MLKRRVVLAAGSASLVASASLAQGDLPIEKLLADLMWRRRVPSAELTVIRGGEIAERIAVGADPQTLFQAASISKVVTGIAVMRLVEQGRIGLDTPVNEMLRSAPGPDSVQERSISFTGVSSPMRPCSTSRITATPVTTLLIEAAWNRV